MKSIGILAVSASASGFALAAIAKGNTPDESVLRSPVNARHPSLDGLDAGADYATGDEIVLFDNED